MTLLGFRIEPKPTWRAILAALRSPAVNLPQLAMRVEAEHFPDPTAARDASPTSPTGMYVYAVSLTQYLLYLPERSEAISHVTNSETSSTLSSGELIQLLFIYLLP